MSNRRSGGGGLLPQRRDITDGVEEDAEEWVSERRGQSSWVILDETSRHIWASMANGILLGAIDRRSGRVQLVQAAPVTDANGKRFSGHRDMLRYGAISETERVGFSLEIASGEIRAFYRTSILNREYEDFAIPNDMMLALLAVIGFPRSAHFPSYP